MCRAQTTSEASSLLPKSVSTLNVCRPSRIASALQAQDSNVLEMSPAVSGKSRILPRSVSLLKVCQPSKIASVQQLHAHIKFIMPISTRTCPNIMPCPSSAVAKQSQMWQHAGSIEEHAWRFV